MNAPGKKTPFGFLILGTLLGAAIGGVLSNWDNLGVNALVGIILGLLGGVAADIAFAKRQPKLPHVVLVGLIALVLATLLRPFVVPPSNDADWSAIQQQLMQREDRSTPETRALAESFLADVLADRLDAAYAALSPAWKQKLGREEFTAHIRRQPKFKNPRLPLSCEVHESNYYYYYRCQADSAEGKVLEAEIAVGRNGDHPDFGIWDYHVRDPASRP